MATDEHDNRISFPATEVDFADVVGTTGQDHDGFPDGGQQPRFDWMRLYLIGLLSCQSSEEPPTQYRTGTVWFSRSRNAYFVWFNDAWRSLSEFIAVMENTDGSVLSLSDWFELAETKLDSIQPRITYSGSSVVDNVTSIPVPDSVQERIEPIVQYLHPLVYKNGQLIDPRSTRFAEGCPTVIELLNDENLDEGDRFTVIIESFHLMLTDDVVAS
jgi:hypothetical protein